MGADATGTAGIRPVVAKRPAGIWCCRSRDQGGAPVARTASLRELLRKAEWFRALEGQELTWLEQRMRLRRYGAGETICNEGDPGRWMFIVGSGEVGVVSRAEDGTEVQIAVLRRGDCGGMMSLFEDTPRSATLRARNAVELWTLDHATFQQLLQTSTSLSSAMLAFMSQRLREDAQNLATSLRYVSVLGLEEIYHECSPQERLILDTINVKVASAQTLDDLMDFVFRSMQRIGPCDRVSLAFLEEDGQRVVAHWVRTTYESAFLREGYAEDLQATSLASVIERGEPRVIGDLSEYLRDRGDSQSAQLLVREGIRSSMTCPLVADGRIVGVFFRSAREPNAYDEHQVRMHQAIAQRLTQAVEKAYRIEQLQTANNAYLELLGFVSHELKSPVASMMTEAMLLRDGYIGELAADQQASMERMIAKGNYLLDIVREYLDLARLEGGQLEPRLTAVADFAAEVIAPAEDIVRPQLEEKQMTLVRRTPEHALAVECDPDLLRIVFVNLLGNAIKYGHEHGEIRLQVSCDGRRLEASVWNEGPGFPEDQRPRLFRRFSRLNTPALLKQKGTGVGLYTSWRIVQLHGGSIWAESEEGKWAEFAFGIPQPPEARR